MCNRIVLSADMDDKKDSELALMEEINAFFEDEKFRRQVRNGLNLHKSN